MAPPSNYDQHVSFCAVMNNRREFLRHIAAAAGGPPLVQAADASAIVIDPKPLFDISPYLYMQFMEPLGITDSSVEAAWDYDIDDWRTDFVSTVRDLAPDVIRYGGLYSRYYKWRDGVGPPSKRPLTRNYVWGGKETNRVGTGEFVRLCRMASAEPLYCVNFLGDGERRFRTTSEGNRTGDARDAADWVSYANDPDNRERRAHGVVEPYGIKLWQIGNETSYGNVTFSKDESIAHTIDFAKAMKERDPTIQLIGWGDRGGSSGYWAPDLVRRAGEHLDYVAFHMMGQHPTRPDTVLKGLRYQSEPEKAWDELLELSNAVETRVSEFEQAISGAREGTGIAITEGHLSLSPGNTNPILCEWLSAVYHARSMNIYQRHGKYVRIATAADFQGNRWTVTALMLQTPRGISYFTPAGSVMRLFKRHNGRQGVAVQSAPASLDIAASRNGNRYYLHVANTDYRRPVEGRLTVQGLTITGGHVYEIAPLDLRQYVNQDQPDIFRPHESTLPGPSPVWRFPAGSVSAIELETAGT
jgi:hypothetical protein